MKERFFFIVNNLGLKNCIFLVIIFFFISIFEILGIGLIIPLISVLFGKINPSFFENLNLNFDLSFLNNDLFAKYILTTFLLVYFLKTILFIYSVTLKNKIVFDLQKKFSYLIYNYFLNLPYLKFINKNSSIAIKIMTQTTSSATSSFILPIIVIVSELFIILLLSILLLLVDPYSTSIIILIFSVGIYLISTHSKKKNFKWGMISETYHLKKIKVLTETLRSYREILIYNKGKFFKGVFEEKNNQHITSLEKHTSWLEYPRSLLEFLIIICAVIFVFIAMSSNVSTEEVVTKIGIFILAGLRLLPSSSRITNSLNSIRFGKPSFDTIFQLLKSRHKAKLFLTKEKYSIKDSIKFKNVSFKYKKNSNNYGVKNLNFEIKKNKITGIYGKSGSGKSTIINLILGFIKANSGVITIDGLSLKNVTHKLRNNIGYVPQETFLLDSSLKENIAFGEKLNNINKKNLIQSLTQAEIFDFVKKLPKKLNTIVGENGVKISGGEKQRIGIARALYESREILIFDEPTSSLDKVTEDKIFKTIKKLKKTKTIIIISHSDKFKKISDNIIQL